jgi:hypothetical protein
MALIPLSSTFQHQLVVETVSLPLVLVMSVLFDLSLEVSLVIITAIGMTVFTKQHRIDNIKLSR